MQKLIIIGNFDSFISYSILNLIHLVIELYPYVAKCRIEANLIRKRMTTSIKAKLQIGGKVKGTITLLTLYAELPFVLNKIEHKLSQKQINGIIIS